jgi:hypothetical protein
VRRKSWRDKATVGDEDAYNKACDALGPHDKISEEIWERTRNGILHRLFHDDKMSLRLLAEASGYSASNVKRYIERHAQRVASNVAKALQED